MKNLQNLVFNGGRVFLPAKICFKRDTGKSKLHKDEKSITGETPALL